MSAGEWPCGIQNKLYISMKKKRIDFYIHELDQNASWQLIPNEPMRILCDLTYRSMEFPPFHINTFDMKHYRKCENKGERRKMKLVLFILNVYSWKERILV